MHLTTTGRWTLLLSVVLASLGFLLGVEALLATGVAGIGATLLAFAIVLEAPQVTVLRNASPLDVPRGMPSEVTLQFIGRARRPRPFGLIEHVDGKPFAAEMPALEAGASTMVRYPLDTSRRGVIETGPAVVRRRDLFGLVTAEVVMSERLAVAVRPRRVQVTALPTGTLRDLEGPTREVSQGTATFHQLRDYVPGDDLRLVHWRTTARTGQLVVRQMVDTSHPQVVVVIDNRQSVASDNDFEVIIEIAHSILFAARRDQFPFQLMFTAGQDPATEAIVDDDRFLDRLTTARLATVTGLDSLTEMPSSQGRSLVLLTGQPSAADLPAISRFGSTFGSGHLVSVALERTVPFVSPPGITGLACSSAEEFAAEWNAIR